MKSIRHHAALSRFCTEGRNAADCPGAFGVGARRGAPLAAKAALTVDDVLDQQMVIFPRRICHLLRCHFAKTTQRAVAAGCTGGIQMQTIVNLVSAGLGVPGCQRVSGSSSVTGWLLQRCRQGKQPATRTAGRAVRPFVRDARPAWFGQQAAQSALERFMASSGVERVKSLLCPKLPTVRTRTLRVLTFEALS